MCKRHSAPGAELTLLYPVQNYITPIYLFTYLNCFVKLGRIDLIEFRRLFNCLLVDYSNIEKIL